MFSSLWDWITFRMVFSLSAVKTGLHLPGRLLLLSFCKKSLCKRVLHTFGKRFSNRHKLIIFLKLFFHVNKLKMIVKMQFWGVKRYFKNIYNNKSPCPIETHVLQVSSLMPYPLCYKKIRHICLIYNILFWNYFLMQLAANMCT